MGYRDTAADTISRALHPLVVAVPLSALFLATAGLPLSVVYRWTATTIAVVVLPLAVYMYREEGYSLREPNDREHRERLYLIGMMELAVFGVLIYLSDLPATVETVFLGAALTVAAGSLINERTKVSIHTGAMSSFAVAFYFHSAAIAATLALGTVAAGWSRLQLERHTKSQVLIAGLLPVFTMGVPLALL
ncbi:MAG: hypothetical protein ABEI58_01380 [Candidatus Nanohaloarchaea archaeon]